VVSLWPKVDSLLEIIEDISPSVIMIGIELPNVTVCIVLAVKCMLKQKLEFKICENNADKQGKIAKNAADLFGVM
jgi:hypothetical protein